MTRLYGQPQRKNKTLKVLSVTLLIFFIVSNVTWMILLFNLGCFHKVQPVFNLNRDVFLRTGSFFYRSVI